MKRREKNKEGREREREVGIEGWRKVLLVGFREKKVGSREDGDEFLEGIYIFESGILCWLVFI